MKKKQQMQQSNAVLYANNYTNQVEEDSNDGNKEPKPPQIPQKYVIILGAIAATLMIMCAYGTTSALNNIPLDSASAYTNFVYAWPAWLDHMYFSMSRPVWTICLAIIVLICFFKEGGYVQSFLELKIFVPIGKISFSAYLVHPMILEWFYYSRTDGLYYTDSNFAAIYAGVIFIVFGISLAIHLLIESPLIKLEKILTGENKKLKKSRNNEVEGPSILPYKQNFAYRQVATTENSMK